jgi:hypothetical protein
MTSAEKLKLVNAFEKGANAFDDVLSLPTAVVNFRPMPDAWTIHEHVVHCLEVDIANFHRYRRAIAQPETKVLSFDQVWTSALDYPSHDLSASLVLIKLLRRYMAIHLRSLADRDWTQFAYIHSKAGRVNLEEAVTSYVDHVRFHQELIDRNVRFWEETRGRA